MALDRGYETVTHARQGLNIPRFLRIVTKCSPNLVN